MSIDPPFVPVPVRARRDGWTPARQHAILAALRKHRCVAAACRAVAMSWQTAYRLRGRPDAASFAAAWDDALAGPDSPRPFSGRALDGSATPIMYRGRQVGERRRFDNRLAMYILQLRCPQRYGSADALATDRRDPGAAYAQALAALADDLAAGPAPSDEPDLSGNVARTSSPSAKPAKLAQRPSPANAGAQDRGVASLRAASGVGDPAPRSRRSRGKQKYPRLVPHAAPARTHECQSTPP